MKAPNAVQSQSDQGLSLIGRPSDGTADLLDCKLRLRPRITSISAALGRGRCSCEASLHGARIQTSHSSFVVRMTASPWHAQARRRCSPRRSESHREDASPRSDWVSCCVRLPIRSRCRRTQRPTATDRAQTHDVLFPAIGCGEPSGFLSDFGLALSLYSEKLLAGTRQLLSALVQRRQW